ncbi:hypothetical protein PHISP_06353 [Aspergillus sp. HF37]|nr:hypothetical protein PHISP_06353 [Aspergillus sp. HF37]
MGEVTLDRAIALLSSEKQRERSDGLADLKHILQQNKWSSKLTTLSDKACYKIFDSLFRFILVEKPAYARAQRSNSKGPSGSRLSACASVIRTAVDVLLRNLRTRSVRAIVYDITDTLSVPGEGLWELLSVDYTKALAALLRYPPHVEHLGDDEWGTLIKFCLRGLGLHGDDDFQSSLRNGPRSTLDDYFDAGSGRSTPSGMRPTLAIRERHVGDQSVIEEILVCIQLLIASPNAPVQADAEKILRGLGEFVKSTSVAGSAHQAAFHSINTVVTKALFDQSTLVRASLLDLIPVIRRLWATKHTGLKDELLVTSMFCTIILGDATRREPSESLADLVEGLLDTLYSEYTKRPEKEILQLDELVFYQTNSMQLEKPIVRPRLGSVKSEHNWTVVWAIASLLQLTEEMATRSSVPRTLPEAPFKKQRFTSAVDDIFRDSFSSSGMKRVCALQLIPFLLRGQISLDSKSSLLQRLTPNIADDNASLSSWTMLAIARCHCLHTRRKNTFPEIMLAEGLGYHVPCLYFPPRVQSCLHPHEYYSPM